MPTRIHGSIKFKNVGFRYPSRAETEVLRNFSLNIKPGSTVAFVGSSGSGRVQRINYRNGKIKFNN